MSTNSDTKWLTIGSLASGGICGLAATAVVSRLFKSSAVENAKAMTKQCDLYAELTESDIDEENDYILEIDNDFSAIEFLQEEQTKKQEELLCKIKELELKAENETITEEEEQDLENYKSQLANLSGYTLEINTKREAVNKKTNLFINKISENIAERKEFGNTAKEKGTDLANTKVSGGVFKKLLGKSGKSKKRAGENLLKSADNLLDKIAEADSLKSKIKGKK